MGLIFAKIVLWVTANRRIVAVGVGGIVLLVLIVFAFKGCSRREVKIDESQIQKINSENERERKAELEKIVFENESTIRTVDERSNLAEVNRVERERKIDEKIAEVDKKISEAKSQGKDITGAELECLLVPENCK